MSPYAELIHRGGPVIYAIMGLSVILYAYCFDLLSLLMRQRRSLQAVRLVGSASDHARVRWLKAEWQEAFLRQRVVIGAMIAAAPLLGLLGTVNGMIGIFESLSSHGGRNSMEGLAGGISEVLVATESGLAVAIPAMLLLYYAHRQTQKSLASLEELERAMRAGT
jgi:hypothetical protein